MKVLIIGIAGGLAGLTAKLLLKKYSDIEIIGVDSRKIKDSQKIPNVRMKTIRYSRGNFEKLFRENEFDYVLHLGRMSHSSVTHENLSKRLELSVMGTSRILDLSHRFKVKKVIVLSTFHVYGAIADNSIFLKEESPLRAALKYSELRDVVEMDQICTNWMWKHKDEMETVVFRPCNIIGSQIKNTMSHYLTSSMTLRPMDFNPVFQFIHEFDMATILSRALEEVPTGTYNVATDDFITLKKALKIANGKSIPFPMSLASPINKLLKQVKLNIPDYLIDYLKYSCLIDNKSLKDVLGENFYRFRIEETLKLVNLK